MTNCEPAPLPDPHQNPTQADSEADPLPAGLTHLPVIVHLAPDVTDANPTPATDTPGTRDPATDPDSGASPATDPGPDPGVDSGMVHGPGGSGLSVEDLVGAGVLDVVPGQPSVPISVWRVAEAGDLAGGVPAAGDRSADGGWAEAFGYALAPRLAALLVATYTDRGDLILDACNDTALAGVAGASARAYQPAASFGQFARLAMDPDLAGNVALVVLRWPPDPTRPDSGAGSGNPISGVGPAGGTRPVDAGFAASASAVGLEGPQVAAVLFAACRQLMTPDGTTVVILPTAPGLGPYIAHANLIIPAARAAGLGYLQHIVAITVPLAALHTTSTGQAIHPMAWTRPDPIPPALIPPDPIPPAADERTPPGPDHTGTGEAWRGQAGDGDALPAAARPVPSPGAAPAAIPLHVPGHIDLLAFVLRRDPR